VEDLVGMGVADPVEQVRVSEGSLDRMILLPERGLERVECRRENLQAARILFAEGGFALKQVQ
jgi:hypothetical protein